MSTSKTLRAMQARKAAAVKEARGLTDAAATESRDLSAEENTRVDTLMSEIDGLNARIEREQRLLAAEADAGLPIADLPRVSGAEEGIERDPQRGFAHFGEFARVVQAAAHNPGAVDERLRIGAASPTSYGNESSGPDGGFLIPPQFSRAIMTLSLDNQALLPMTDNTDVTGNSMVFPKDETTPWGTDGIRAYWQAEANAGKDTKPKLSTTVLRLHKLMALVPLTDELLADGPALGQYLSKKVGDSIRWKTNEAILYGNGNGQPVGVLNGKAVITVAKDSGQATNTLSALNLANMVARLPSGSYGRAVWLINNDVLPALFTLTLGNYPIYLPMGAGGFKDSPYGMLLGRPVMVSQHAASFSSLGDVQLHDLSFYRTITKAGGVETATSMHLYFDADATAFRTLFRLDGQPGIASAINPAKGSNTLSPFIQLAAR